ncbi:hypothetical protein SAMN05660443_0234 [Marinospirillum celere]|uniref:Uncharacterized protein n=1 Tax=Marinospirillum celere TaxID=1122252 RepID=A0A1I1E063_9GAMM|nr:hypothetical protein [Marinospirillum celere]SFB80464.1 hypothetical protein SAMN05660443_0234 [Marinospirillum celere]
MSKLFIEVSPADKGRWVACAAREGKTLQEWVTQLLNAEASRNPPPPPKWMREAGFSNRLATALLRAGYHDSDVLSGSLRQEPDDYWYQHQDFGPRCLRELKEKWPV